VIFLNDRKEAVKEECPGITFKDRSRKMADEWTQMSLENRQSYVSRSRVSTTRPALFNYLLCQVTRAALERERYNKELVAYHQTDEYKDYLETQRETEEKTDSVSSNENVKGRDRRSETERNHATPCAQPKSNESVGDEVPPATNENARKSMNGKGPKKPLCAYGLFLDDRRPAVMRECRDITISDFHRKMSKEWTQLPHDVRQKYEKAAQGGKEDANNRERQQQAAQQGAPKEPAREEAAPAATDSLASKLLERRHFFERLELKEFQLPDDYRPLMDEVRNTKQQPEKVNQPKNKSDKSKNAKNSTVQPMQEKAKTSGSEKSKGKTAPAATALDPSEKEKTASRSDFPIFTDEFVELNRGIESEQRLLKKQVSEAEEQNAVLQTHVESMESAASKLEAETAQLNENSAALMQHLDSLRRLIVAGLNDVGLAANVDDVDGLIERLRAFDSKKSASSREADDLRAVKKALSGLNVNSF
jgi:hypothetical protein